MSVVTCSLYFPLFFSALSSLSLSLVLSPRSTCSLSSLTRCAYASKPLHKRGPATENRTMITTTGRPRAPARLMFEFSLLATIFRLWPTVRLFPCSPSPSRPVTHCPCFALFYCCILSNSENLKALLICCFNTPFTCSLKHIVNVV